MNEEIDILQIKRYLDPCISVIRLRKHTKASELYVDIEVHQDGGQVWKGCIPYYYRRTGLFIENEEDLATYLNDSLPYFSFAHIKQFVVQEKSRWETEFTNKKVTKPFFDVLLNMRWNSVSKDLPSNPNWARRIQDIKELGYTLATDTNRKIADTNETDTHILLLPIPKGGSIAYEVMSSSFKKRAIRALEATNIYELSSSNQAGLLPDHKFPEIRWDSNTSESNEGLSEAEIKAKFQLLDNQRNLQKREIGRKCFQTGLRGIIFGIPYFYQGDNNWPTNVPKTGKNAEQGCIGCGWYDLQEWRIQLNNLIQSLSKE